jgi:two-component system CheB/CheR fusion protein
MIADEDNEEERSSALPPADEGLDALLDFIRKSRGFDFGGYKRTSLARRIRRRVQATGTSGFTAYRDYLEGHAAAEFPLLFDLLLINVTGFFRDPPAWHALASRLPTIMDTTSDAPIRVWSAGCSSGEEPYTVVMILAEALGAEAFTRRVKIYATDIDEDALMEARRGAYTDKAVEGVPPALLEKYFTRSGAHHVFHRDLRRAVIFGRHDLVHDAPIPRIDVLVCRNSLMYFNAETQSRILQRLRFALNPRGLLFLGKAEMLLTHPELFSPVDMKLRLFGRAGGGRRERPADARAPISQSTTTEAGARLHEAAFDGSSVAQLVVDAGGALVLANRRATALFGIGVSDLGRAFDEVELAYRPAELLACIDKVRTERRAFQLREVERVVASGDPTVLDIELSPLVAENGAFLGTQLSFVDVTQTQQLQKELRAVERELEAAHAQLQVASEELETTNEELQSTNEELETMNDELQSTNAELETMNEELQSTNAELQTINDELRQRGLELDEVHAYHDAVLGSLGSGIAVLDRELRVRTWNPRMEDLMGAVAEEALGKSFTELDVDLPVARFDAALRRCLTNGEGADEEMDHPSRRVQCRLKVMPLRRDVDGGLVITVEEVR